MGKFWDKSGNPTICFVFEPIFQVRKNFSLFGTLGHSSVVFVKALNQKPSAESSIEKVFSLTQMLSAEGRSIKVLFFSKNLKFILPYLDAA